MNQSYRSFTLVELILVVVIIGVLSGIGLSVLNPRRQIFKSQEAVLRGNVAKICSAMTACMGGQVGTLNTDNCDTAAEISVVTNAGGGIGITEPDTSTYTISEGGPSTTDSNGWVKITGSVTNTGCSYACVTSNNMSVQTVDGSARMPGQVYAVNSSCIL